MFRYRQLTDNLADPRRVGGDMTFGRGINNFLADNPTAVAQAILTRLRLWQGDWFLNLQEGVPYLQQILGHAPSANVPDSAIRATILGTPFVRSISDYTSSWLSTARNFTVSCKVMTAFGPITRAPIGALISPSGALVLPLSAHPAAPVGSVQNQPSRPEQRRLAPPVRRLPPP
jgi:hypothetical protein